MQVLREKDLTANSGDVNDFDLRGTGIRGVIVMGQVNTNGSNVFRLQNAAATKITIAVTLSVPQGGSAEDVLFGFPCLCDVLRVSCFANGTVLRLVFVSEPLRPFGVVQLGAVASTMTPSGTATTTIAAPMGVFVRRVQLVGSASAAGRLGLRMTFNGGALTQPDLIVLAGATGGAGSSLVVPSQGDIAIRLQNDDGAQNNNFVGQAFGYLGSP